jgi:hypothetical protein
MKMHMQEYQKKPGEEATLMFTAGLVGVAPRDWHL